MGSGRSPIGDSKGKGYKSFLQKVNDLQEPKEPTMFSDAKVSPLAYDGSKVMKVAFGNWKTDDNFKGVQEVPVSKIVSVQPYVQSHKLLGFDGDIDTSTVSVLKIGDKFYLGDGNHRIVTAFLRGNKKVNVKVYEE